MLRRLGIIFFMILAANVGAASAAPLKIDPNLPDYKTADGVTGEIDSIGSDAMSHLMAMWAEAFHNKYPDINIKFEGTGSNTAPPALVAGTAQIGPMSRKMESGEIDQFERRYGFKPTRIGVALDTLAVIVNKDNPIKSTSLEKLDAAFSKTRKRGYDLDIVVWGQMGVAGKIASQPLSLYGSNHASGTYRFFREYTLAKGEYKDSVNGQPGPASVVQGIARDKNGIGYSEIGYMTSGVKAIDLSLIEGTQAHAPTYENVLNGKYPLGRMLYIYVVKQPDKPLPKLQEEFIKFILSREGQEIVAKNSFLPLSKNILDQQLSIVK